MLYKLTSDKFRASLYTMTAIKQDSTHSAETIFEPSINHLHTSRHRKQLSELEGNFLRSVYDLHYVTIPQLARLHYKKVTRSILTYVAAQLKALDEEHADYVQRGYLGRAVRFGHNPSVFRLSRRGINHMASLRLSPLPNFRPSDPFPSFDKLAHTLEINDFIVAAKQLTSYSPGYSLVQCIHDWIFQHNPVVIANGKKQESKVAVIPDAWLDFRLPAAPDCPRPPRLPIHLELDRGTENQMDTFKAKLHSLLTYIDGPYEQRFNTKLITIAFAVAGKVNRPLRHDLIRTWCEQVLKERNRENDASVFYFCALPEGTLDPTWLFLRPVWLTPFDTTPKVLLDPTI